jgi:dynein heavy chain, axonemal
LCHGKNVNFAPNGMDYVKTLENGVQFGRWVLLENIQETLDAASEPILLQQKFKQGGQEMMKIGDNNIPYIDSFRFFMTKNYRIHIILQKYKSKYHY